MSIPGSVIKKTQDTLGRYVKKPTLSEKLLGKPPFRFLHDVISVVVRDHGKFRGLFTQSEMNSNNVKDKESKLKYLDKIIRASSFATGALIEAKPGKIVSGQEPTKTNEFLQALATVISKKIDTSEAVKKTLSGEKPESSKRKPRSTKKDSPSSRRSSSIAADDSSKKDSASSRRTSITEEQSVSSASNKSQRIPDDEIIPTTEKEAPPELIEVPEETPQEEATPEEEPKNIIEPEPLNRPESVSRTITNRVKSAMRPPSSRPAAPRLREKPSVEPEELIRPGTSSKPVNLILAKEGADEEDEEDNNFLIQENNEDVLHLEDRVDLAIDSHEVVEAEGKEHGGLVQEILATQKELKSAEDKQKVVVNIERDTELTDLTYRRERESTQREINRLKESIQTLTRYANPLGKLMNFLQEDVDSMQRELDTWRNERKQLTAKLNQEEFLTQKSIQPLKDHLIEIEHNVLEQLDKISSVKGKILKNDEKIAKMLSSISNK